MMFEDWPVGSVHTRDGGGVIVKIGEEPDDSGVMKTTELETT